MGANSLEASVLGEVKLSRKREMRKTRWVGRCSLGAEEKREKFWCEDREVCGAEQYLSRSCLDSGFCYTQ